MNKDTDNKEMSEIMLEKVVNVKRVVADFLTHFIQTLYSIVKLLITLPKPFKIKKGLNSQLNILGNGPSLSDTIENIEGASLCVNNFALSDLFYKVKPQFYVIADPAYYTTERSYVHAVLEKLKAVNWEINLFIPYKYINSSFSLELKRNKHVLITPYNHVPIDGFFSFIKFFTLRGIAIPRTYNVLGISLIIGLRLNASSILLHGSDHNWLHDISIGPNNELMLQHKHFTNEKNQSIPVVFPDSGKSVDLLSFLSIQLKNFSSYRTIANIAKSLNIKIINVSKHSLIDSFERIK